MCVALCTFPWVAMEAVRETQDAAGEHIVQGYSCSLQELANSATATLHFWRGGTLCYQTLVKRGGLVLFIAVNMTSAQEIFKILVFKDQNSFYIQTYITSIHNKYFEGNEGAVEVKKEGD